MSLTPGRDSYNNSHSAFLQAIQTRQTFTFEEAKPILAAILTAYEGRPVLANDILFEDFTNYIHTINAALSSFDYEIRSAYPQSASVRSRDTAVYAFVNATSDPQTQLATCRSADEIAYVRRVIDAMFDANNTPAREIMAVKGMEAIHLAKVNRGRDSTAMAGTQANAGYLTIDKAEKTLASLVEEGWFEKSKAGYYSLSARALMELRSWLVDTYNNPDEEEGAWQPIKTCEVCREIITVGQRCANNNCPCRLHDFCAQNILRAKNKCPRCKTDWDEERFVGERVIKGVQSRPSTSSRRAVQESEDDEEEDGTEEEEEEEEE
ncbi:DNA repair protein Nse1 [Trichodelitschia bisporula]|uniref:Non-structural maintenance of chromosomes element 1 homolog n=1 Tax=Trichodelitschia bisporula TaxID=703511 RepID=A0A6G1HJZ1_9PEZI|nr:DNA repair protein Nse1 [Trichodelitschia bisporula]